MTNSTAAQQTDHGANAASLAVRHRVLLLVLIGLLLYVPSNGLRDMWYADEPDIAEVAKAMADSGDWVAPRRMGVIWVDYPPMIYWTGVVSAHLLGGVDEFALRLPSALAAVALVLLTCVAGSRWFGPVAGLWSGLTLLTFLQFAQQAVGYRPDMLFSLFIAAGFFAYAAGSGERPRLLLRVAAFALFGLAMLSKGPLGVLLPGLVLTLWHATRREWRRLLELAPLALVSVAVYLPWFLACARAMGADDILSELYAQNIARFVSAHRAHGKPVYYYLVNIWGDLAPWSPLVPFALVWIHRARRWRDREVQLLLWWLGAFFVFLSIAVTKRQLYLLPAYPAFALVLGAWIAAALDPEVAAPDRPATKPVRVYGLLYPVVLIALSAALAGALLTFSSIIERQQLVGPGLDGALALRAPVLALAVTLAGAALWILRAGLGRDTRAVLVRTAASQIAVYALLLAWLLPAANPLKTVRPAAEWIRHEIGDESRFGLVFNRSGYGFRSMGAFGLYSGAIADLLEGRDQVEDFFRRHPTSIVLIESNEIDDTFGASEPEWRARAVRELWFGRDRFLVFRAPDRDLLTPE